MEKDESYKQIVKSTGIVGGTQILNILIGIVRMKFLAILLGPSGVGMAGIFQTIIDLVRDATGFGINFSGVKNIAEVSGSDDKNKVSKTITILRRWALGTGLLGMVIIVAFSSIFSLHSFGSTNQTQSIIFLSIIVLTSSISASQVALLQGLRKISQMAQANLFGTLFGTAISMPLYYVYGINGIVPGMILTSIGAMAISWIYARKIKVENLSISFIETIKGGIGMAKLGFFIVVNGFLATLSMYIIRSFLVKKGGIEMVGYFQAVMTISTVYMNVLLHAMLADYFPRLTLVQNDNVKSNKLINEQLEITLLIGTPMLIAVIIFAPIGINILYSSSFSVAVPVLRWQMAGSFFTLVSWPLGVLYLAKNAGWYAVITETFRQCVYIGLLYFLWNFYKFESIGIGFFIASFLNMIFVILSLKKISNFVFSTVNFKYIVFLGISVVLTLFISSQLNMILSYILNCILLICIFYLCFIKLNTLTGIGSTIRTKFPLFKRNK
ncbi:oligosaccharide flippase family protein [Pedobacter sp. MR22-3]|uniref:oligosaccharide flippase family protein n=1 Tax=Pedobacter sp. MR22-3 TaxID=2994552 RepID=UPI0022464A46|nr:oligosaccharide flippase family protein [Pedobacter sp. MR22-3]MCX2582896.1 oligosaccharide flippase family protein [Pedobacter sp. MR22-3]